MKEIMLLDLHLYIHKCNGDCLQQRGYDTNELKVATAVLHVYKYITTDGYNELEKHCLCVRNGVTLSRLLRR